MAILGVAVGALTTFLTKFIEAEFQYQQSLKVLEYADHCSNPEKSAGFFKANCTITVKAVGKKTIKGIKLNVVSFPNASDASNTEPIIRILALNNAPEFFPPDPLPQLSTDASQPGAASVLIERLKEPQQISWKFDVLSIHPIDVETQIQRTVLLQDEDAQAQDGPAWRWKRWSSVLIVGPSSAVVIIVMLLMTMWIFRVRKEETSRDAHRAVDDDSKFNYES